jgi:hypothetical protein
MPEIVHSFQRGRMNKDLDERLVPNGEYRDALNLDLANSDGANVGAFQNVQGNTELNNMFGSVITAWSTNSINDLTNAVCIGSIRNDATERIYWFIASDEASIIAEYNQITDTIRPILVDTNSILNFSENYLITGINILDGKIIFTDNQTEPKKVDIEKYAKGSVDFLTHTKVPNWDYSANAFSPVLTGQPDFIEADITVIKKSPLKAPRLEMATSIFGNNINGTTSTPVITFASTPVVGYASGNENFTFVPDTTEPLAYESLHTYGEYLSNIADDVDYYINSNIPLWDGKIRFTISPIYGLDPSTGLPIWNVGTVLALKGTFENDYNEEFEYQVRVKISQLNNNIITAEIQSISSDILTFDDENGVPQLIAWEVSIEEEAPMFEYVFPRFAYRWKYLSNEYSCYSPFSEVAFLGAEFKYESSDGYNIGMTNNIRKLIVKDLEWGSDDVEAIEVLYKETSDVAVFVVDTIKKKDYINQTLPNELPITSEIIGNAVEANQLLRPWDNVPKKAKAQEIIGNRIVYGNYEQNYDVDSVKLDVSLANSIITDIRQPHPSLKSIRTYQVGVAFKDLYGRETPIFTNKTASVNVGVENATNATKLIVNSFEAPPSWASHFKFFVKETSNQYYNLAMDRFYPAEDGNVWLSFPSSERNKLDEETYLILKKQHDNDNPVTELVRYKVLAIENEAPKFISAFRNSVAFSTVTIDSGFSVNSLFLNFSGPDEGSFSASIKSTNYIEISYGGNKTDQYKIASGGRTGTSNDYEVKLAEIMNADADFLNALSPGTKVDINVYEEIDENKPEFDGRFFAKINRDINFDINIIEPFNALALRYGAITQLEMREMYSTLAIQGNVEARAGVYYMDYPVENNPSKLLGQGSWGGFGSGIRQDIKDHYSPPTQGNIWFGLARCGHSANAYLGDILGYAGDTINGGMLHPGTKIRFKNTITGDVGETVYTIEESACDYHQRWDNSGETKASMRRTAFIVKLNKPIDDIWLPAFNGDLTKLNASKPEIQIVEEVTGQNNKLLTSTNPAIFETEPKEAIDLDLYYEASDALPIIKYNTTSTLLNWFNCFSYGNGVESNRIRDDYNAVMIDKGPKVSAPLDEPYAVERRSSGFIFSQIYNSSTGINRLNQFIQAEAITKDLNPAHGSIQKLHARDTDLITLCEDKCFRVLANKDALFNANGNVNVTSNNAVLGQAVPYAGEFGISKNPESFASYGFRAYFTDKNRGAIIRLSVDGITNIAEKGMADFFADNLRVSTKLIGSYDDDKDLYNLTLNGLSSNWQLKLSPDRDYQIDPGCSATTEELTTQTTVSFKEAVDGWTSRKSFISENGLSLNNIYYTFKNGKAWEHSKNPIYNNFYNTQYDSSFTMLINEQPQAVKGFSTLNYTGTATRLYEYQYNGKWYSLAEINANLTIPTVVRQKQPGWYTDYIKTDLEGGEIKEFQKKEGKYFNYIKGLQVFNDCQLLGEPVGSITEVEAEPQSYILTLTLTDVCSK